MSAGLSILKGELCGLLGGIGSGLSQAGAVRSASDRTDRYVMLVRDVLHNSSLCYIDDMLSFFDGRAYCSVSRAELLSVLSNALTECGVGATDIRRIGDMPLSVLLDKAHPLDCGHVVFSNAVYDVNDGTVTPFSMDYHTDYILPYGYDGGMSCPLWGTFLEEVLPDEGERLCLQEFFGMCFIDRSRLSLEKFAVFIGKGSNGKSVIFEVMKRVFGEDRLSYLSPEQLMDNKQVVTVRGKRLNFAADIRRSAAFDSALKALSSGQEVQGWEMYRGNVLVKCPPLAFALNEMPVFRDTTDAFFRRVLLFSFDVVIPQERQDRTLASRICATELGGIFNWVMEGRRRLIRNGGYFSESEKMESSLKELKRRVRGDNNPARTYLESIGYSTMPCYDGQMPERVSASVIYEGLDGAVSKDAITKELSSYGVRRDRGSEVRYFLYKQI